VPVTPRIAMIAPFIAPLLSDEPVPGGGGAERQMALIARGLAQRGWDVHVLLRDAPRGRPTPGLRTWVVPFRYLGGPKRHLLPDLLALRRTLRQVRPDIIGIRNGGPYITASLIAHRWITRTPFVVWLQSDHDILPGVFYPNERSFAQRLPARAYKFSLRFADLLIAQTERQWQIAARVGRDAILIRNIAGMPRSDARPSPAPTCPPGYVLWAGSLAPNKRPALLRAVARLAPELRFMAAANGTNAEALARFGAQFQGLPNVKFLGAVPPADMEAWFAGTGCLLNTSAEEGFPNTFLQAWQYGAPVVTAGVDPDGVITAHGLGLVSPVRDESEAEVRALAASLSPLLSDDALRESVAAKARQYIADHHSQDANLSALDRVLRQTIAARTNTRRSLRPQKGTEGTRSGFRRREREEPQRTARKHQEKPEIIPPTTPTRG